MHHWTSHWGPGRKAPPPPSGQRGKEFKTRSINFMQFPATLVQLAEKPSPSSKRGKQFWEWIYPFYAISSNFGSGGRKAPPPHSERGKIVRLNLSISCNFQQLWFSWQKKPPFPHTPQQPKREKFWDWIYPFHAISSNFGSAGRKAPPHGQRGKKLRLNLSISCNFQQLWFSWQKSPLPHTPQQLKREEILRMNLSIWVQLAEKHPPPWPKREKILRLNLSILCNFQQLWFSWQKSPPPPIGQITWQKFTQGLQPVMKNYLPGTVTPLVEFFFFVFFILKFHQHQIMLHLPILSVLNVAPENENCCVCLKRSLIILQFYCVYLCYSVSIASNVNWLYTDVFIYSRNKAINKAA